MDHRYKVSPDEIAQFLATSYDMAEKARLMHDDARATIQEVRWKWQRTRSQFEQLAENGSYNLRLRRIEMLSWLLEEAMKITGAQKGNLQLFDQNSRALRIEVQSGFEEPFLNFFGRVHDGQAACGAAMNGKQRVVVEDVTDSPIFQGTPALEVLLDAGVRSVQSTPLITVSGVVLGILSTHGSRPGQPHPRELSLLDVLARNAAGWLESLMPPSDSGWFRRGVVQQGLEQVGGDPRTSEGSIVERSADGRG